MNLQEAVAARRSIRAFESRSVPRADVEYAISLAVQAPAPHHSAPWRFVLVEETASKERFSTAMGARWRADLLGDGVAPGKADEITERSHRLLAATPLLTVACADMARAHSYRDDRRRLAEWSLFAHSVGAALQTYMLALAERGIGSCWISAPVFCGAEVKDALDLPPSVEPHALVLAGYASPEYRPRARPVPDPRDYIIGSW